MERWVYIGDGVYASFDGYYITLRLGSHENAQGQILLEPSVFDSLVKFAAKAKDGLTAVQREDV